MKLKNLKFHGRFYLISPVIVLLIIALNFAGCSDNNSPTGPGNGGTPGTNEVFMQNSAFTPPNLNVAVGTTVKWINKDNLTHNVISQNPNEPFNSGNMNLNAEFIHTFNEAGTFNYHCSLHPGMTGVITVQ
jgi:plastocyanin